MRRIFCHCGASDLCVSRWLEASFESRQGNTVYGPRYSLAFLGTEILPVDSGLSGPLLVVFPVDLSDANVSFLFERESVMFWWGLILFVLVAPFLVFGLYRWTLTDPTIKREAAKERFQAEQDWRAVRRSGRNN
jgi:hypothetical protein